MDDVVGAIWRLRSTDLDSEGSKTGVAKVTAFSLILEPKRIASVGNQNNDDCTRHNMHVCVPAGRRHALYNASYKKGTDVKCAQEAEPFDTPLGSARAVGN